MKRTHTTRILCLLLALLMTAALLPGCQPTPEEEFVVNRLDGALEEAVLATPAPPAQYEAPERWTESFDVRGQTVRIDVAIEVPDAVEYPVLTVQNASFTAEDVVLAAEVFFGGPVELREPAYGQEEILYDLRSAQRGHAVDDDPETREPIFGPYEGQEEDIARLQEQLASAGDESALFAPFESLPVRSTVLCADGRSITVYASANNWSLNIDPGQSAVMQGESLVASGGAMGDEPPGTQIGAVAITAEQAVERAREMLETIGFSGMQVASVEKARTVNAVTETVLANGYQIILCRGDGGYAPFDPLLLGHSALQIYEQSAYRKDWRPERMQMFVDERGVRYVEQVYPLHVLRTVNENAALLPFARVQELLRNRFRHEFRWTEVSGGTVTVKRVALVGALVRVKNDLERAYIVPTWLCEYTTDTGGTPEQRYAIAVNAIDGTSVDVLLA